VSGVTVAPVRTRRDRRDFLALPAAVHAGDPHHVPEVAREVRRVLDARRNPYFRQAQRTLFLARRGRIPCARLVLVTDRRLLPRGRAHFGFLQARADAEALKACLEAAGAHAAQVGYTHLEGPYDPNPYSQLGVQVDLFDRSPAFFQPHNPPYLPDLLEAAGCRVVKRLQTRRNPDIAATIRAGGPVRWPGARHGLTVRPFDLRHRAADLARVREVFEDAFAANWRFLPVSPEEYAFSARHLGLVTPPELLAIVEHRREPVGVIQCALDVNPALRRLGGRATPLRVLRFFRDRRRIRDLVIFAIGVKQAWQGTRAFALLFESLRWMARDARVLETTWISPENHGVHKVAERLGLLPDREIAIYARETAVRRA